MDAIECLRTRRSIRVFQDKPVPREMVQTILDCGRLACTAINIQPWMFVALESQEQRQKVADLTDHGQFIAKTPVCIAVFCRDVKYYIEDGSAASMNMLNAARALGLGGCWIAGDKKPYAPMVARALGMPQEYKLVSLIALGYPAQEPSPEKRPLAEMVRWERY